MDIKIPSMAEQRRFIFERATKEAIRQLEQNLQAPQVDDLGLDESQYSNAHLLPEERWEPPHPDIVQAYLDQFQRHTDYKTEQALADWLGLLNSEDLQVFRTGEHVPPYGVWRKLLVATGRVPQEVIPVISFMR